LTPAANVLVTSNIIVQLPYWDGHLIGGSGETPTHMCEVPAPTCTGVSANLDAGLSCTYDSGTRRLILTGGITTDTIDEIVFTASDIRNPPGPDFFTGMDFMIADSSNDSY